MSEHLSGRALAGALGVTEGAVRTAVKAGRIKREDDGLFDLTKCRAEWARTTDPVRSKVREAPTQAKPGKAKRGEVSDGQAKVANRSTPARDRSDEALDLTEERARLTKEQADHTALKNAALRGELIPADEAERRWSDEMVALRAAMLGVINDIPVALPHLSAFDVSEIDRVIRARMIKAAHEHAARPDDCPGQG